MIVYNLQEAQDWFGTTTKGVFCKRGEKAVLCFTYEEAEQFFKSKIKKEPPKKIPCGKITYLDKGEALKAIDGIKKRGGSYSRPYRCPYCGAFHITSQMKGEWRSKRINPE